MRAKNVGKNSFFSIFCQVLIILAGFCSQWVINSRLGKEIVGLNGVISNIISIFPVSELGLSTAITYHLYGAIVHGDERKIAALMNLFRRAYGMVAAFITLLGLLFLPFVPLFMRDNPFSTGYVRTIYTLLLIKTVGICLLSYKRALVIADQREYISSLTLMAISVMNYLSIILVVLGTGNYILAFSLGILFEVLINIGLVLYVDRAYPFLKIHRREKADAGLWGAVFGDIKNLFVTRISQRLLGCTDNLILSGFINLAIVGVYSNYCLITQSLMNILQALSNALQPTLGNLAVDRDKKGDYERLQVMSFLFFFLSAIAMCGFYSLGTLFVRDLWLGRGYEMEESTVLLCALNWTLQILGMPISVFLNVSGMFREEKKVMITAAVMNLVLSLGLVMGLGINGVLLGTLSACVIQLVGKSLCYFRKYLGLPLRQYGLMLSLYIALILGEMCLCHALVGLFYREKKILLFLAGGVLCVLLPGVLNTVLFYPTKDVKKMAGIIRALCFKGRDRENGGAAERKCVRR